MEKVKWKVSRFKSVQPRNETCQRFLFVYFNNKKKFNMFSSPWSKVSLRFRRLRLKFQPETGCMRTIILLSLLGEYQWMVTVQGQQPLSQAFLDKTLSRNSRFLWELQVKHIIKHLLTIPIPLGIFQIIWITLYSREISITKLLIWYILKLL